MLLRLSLFSLVINSRPDEAWWPFWLHEAILFFWKDIIEVDHISSKLTLISLENGIFWIIKYSNRNVSTMCHQLISISLPRANPQLNGLRLQKKVQKMWQGLEVNCKYESALSGDVANLCGDTLPEISSDFASLKALPRALRKDC